MTSKARRRHPNQIAAFDRVNALKKPRLGYKSVLRTVHLPEDFAAVWRSLNVRERGAIIERALKRQRPLEPENLPRAAKTGWVSITLAAHIPEHDVEEWEGMHAAWRGELIVDVLAEAYGLELEE